MELREKNLTSDIIQKSKKIEIYAKKKLTDTFLADYHSTFRGHGMSFRDFREYIPGDDIRKISWPLTARTGKPYIKTFEEDREQSIMFAVDVSGSNFFGTKNQKKFDIICQLVALMGFAAIFHRNNVGLCLFSNKVEYFSPPKKSLHQVHKFLLELYSYEFSRGGTSIKLALEYLRNYLKKKTYIVLCSDFMDEGFEHELSFLSAKHSVLSVCIEEPGEKELPNLGLVDFEDWETGEIYTVDTSSTTFRKDYQKAFLKRELERDEALKKSQSEILKISTREDAFKTLSSFFQKRRRVF